MNEDASATFPIRSVSRMTGVNPVTLRAWERRYGLVKPRRTPKGHRLYSQSDVERIHRIVEQLEAGISVSRVSLTESADHDANGESDPRRVWIEYEQRMLSAIRRFDQNVLDQVYNEALALHPVSVTTEQLLVPLLHRLGERWESAAGTVAEEHFFGVYLRSKLGARFHHQSSAADGPVLLTACLPGEQHEIGLLLFALAAHDRHLRVILLGANMPSSDLPNAARVSGCAAIVLGGSIEPPEGFLHKSLPWLVRHAMVPVFVGGRVSARYTDAVARSGAVPLGENLKAALDHIGRVLGREADV